MIKAVGIDVVETDRIIDAMRAHPRFVAKILTPKERERQLTPAYVAGRWAAKEAIAKAVGTHLSWHDVEVVEGVGGRPVAHFLNKEPPGRVHISISHDKTIASAVAVWEE